MVHFCVSPTPQSPYKFRFMDMKTNYSLLLYAARTAVFCAIFGISATFAQQIGLSFHYGLSPAGNVQSTRDGVSLDYTKSSSQSLVMRKFIKKKWAVRVAGSFNDINYTLNNITSTDTISYSATRRDAQLGLGLERHFFVLDKHLDLYGGAQIPFVLVGRDSIISGNYASINNNSSGTGVSILAGANYRLLRIRFGCEYNWNYSTFKSNVWDNASTLTLTGLRRSAQQVAFTVGIYL